MGRVHDSATAVRAIYEDYLSILGAQVVFACLTMAGLALSARLLGPEHYGVVVLCMTIVQLFFIVGTKWSFPAIIRFGRDSLVRQAYMGRVLWAWSPLFFGALVLCVLILTAGSPAIAHLVGSHSPPISLYLAVFVLTAVGMAAVHLLQAQGKMKIAAWVPVTGKLVFAALLAALGLWSDWPVTPTTVMLCLALGLAVQAVQGVISVGRRLVRPVAFDWALTRTMASYSFPLWGGFLAGYVSEWIDLYFLRFFRGHVEVGVYQISYQAFLFLGGGLAGLYILLFPVLTAWRAENRADRMRRYVLRLIPQVSLLWGMVLLLLGVVQAPGFSLFFGSAFAGCSQPFALLLVGLAFHPVIILYGTLLLAHDDSRHHARAAVIMAGVNLLADLLLVPVWGMMGAAYSTTASFIVAAWLCLWWGNRRLNIQSRAALVPSIIVAAALLAIAGQGMALRLLVLLGAALGLVWWARTHGAFSRDDLSMLEQIRCPQWTTALMTKLYTFLSARPACPAQPGG